MVRANIYEAKAKLSELIERAEHGEEVIIARAGKPRVRLVPITSGEKAGKRNIIGRNVLGISHVAPGAFDPMSDKELDEWGL